jgi:hypothetical protein
MITEAQMASIKTPGVKVIRYTKFCSHPFIKYQAAGMASTKDIAISTINSFENKNTMLLTDAPKTLRTPTSLVLCTTIKDTNPYKPRHEIKMAIAANNL